MANDDRRGDWDSNRGDMDRSRGRGEDREWRRNRPERMGDRNARGLSDDPDYGAERYRPGDAYGTDGGGGSMTSDPDPMFSAPGYDASFGGPRFDRADVGSTGTHGVHPISSPSGGGAYGEGHGIAPGGYGSSARMFAAMGQRGQQQQGGGQQRQFDPHYSQWRERQMQQLDQDYEEYCRETQSKFDSEFGAWRERRGQQRQAVGRVKEHMEVVGSDGSHVGTVDGTSGESIVLTRNDPNAGGIHHRIPCAWVESVDQQVKLNLTAEEAMNRWREEGQSQALFERQENGGFEDERSERSTSGSIRDEG
jgi:hypothetical protein